MEADWEIEIGPNTPVADTPVIDACWPDFVDLRIEPDRVRELHEVRDLPALADALVQLNGNDSPVWTAKCDVWPVADVDPSELDAPEEGALHALACYVDLLPRSDRQWADPEAAVAFCRSICARLRASSLRCSRVDLIVRRAVLPKGIGELGITAYLAGCGMTEASAAAQLASALTVFADSVCSDLPPAPEGFKATIEITGE